MNYLPIQLLLFLTASICNAQDPPAPIADLRLLTPSDTKCNAIDDSSEAITIRVWSNFTRQCYGLNELFDADERQTACPKNICQGGIMPLQLDNWDASANYSRVYFDVFKPTSTLRPDAYDPSSVTVRTYAGENCTDRIGTPWYQWGNCNSTESGECKEVGYNVVSVLVTPTWDVETGDECQIAAFRGGAVSEKRVTVASVLVAIVAFSLANLM